MEVTYKKNFNRSYMIIEPEKGAAENYDLKMLANNSIAGLLPVEMSAEDGVLKYWYDITGKQSLSDFLGRRGADNKILRVLFCCLEEIWMELENYMLGEQCVILKEEYIYLTFENGKLYVAYLPGKQGDLWSDFRELMERLLQKLDHGDKEAVAMGYEMHQLSLQTELAFPDMIKTVLQKGKEAEEETKEEGPKEIEISENTWEQDTEPIASIQEEKPKKERKLNWTGVHRFPKLNRRIIRKRELDKYVPYVTHEEEPLEHPTEFLGTCEGEARKLIYQGQGAYTDISLDKEIFLIGKSTQEADGCIKQKSVSRIHAKIEKIDNQYYIEDMNSTNGTFVNGQQLEYRQKMKLKSKDYVVFGAVEFLFI